MGLTGRGRRRARRRPDVPVVVLLRRADARLEPAVVPARGVVRVEDDADALRRRELVARRDAADDARRVELRYVAARHVLVARRLVLGLFAACCLHGGAVGAG